MGETVFTYRGGKKIALDKSSTEIVVRALPETLALIEAEGFEQVSSASTRMTVNATALEGIMDMHRKIAPTHHAYYQADSGADFLITDRVMITFKENVSLSEIDTLAGKYGLITRAKYSNHDFLFQLTDDTGMNPLKLIVKLSEDEPSIAVAEHDLNQLVKRYQFTPPTDDSYISQWHLHSHFNHPEFDQRANSRCEDAWSVLEGFGSDEVTVCVTDDGCRIDHLDFDGPGKFPAWGYFEGTLLRNHTDPSAHPQFMHEHNANHGTSCCGVIGAESDRALTVGAAPNCRLLPIKWESNGRYLLISDSKLLHALNFVADKVDIMSNSWGSSPTGNYSSQVLVRIQELSISGGRRGSGIVFLWAAGNENCLINEQTNVDVPWSNGFGAGGWVGVNTSRNFSHNLVDLPGVMFVAALASNAMRSHYSNYGRGIALCAPSSNSHAYFRMNVEGIGITTASGNMATDITPEFGGTSSATPLVAGVAALVISANPNLSAAEVIAILKQTASKNLNFSNYSRTPPAVYDPDPSWDVSPVAPHDSGAFVDIGSTDGTWSPWFGHGCVDAAAAVARAMGARPPIVGGSTFTSRSDPDRSIPDASERGIRETIICDQSFIVSDMSVSINIEHTYIGDLRVTLTSPEGTTATLHNRSGANQHDLHEIYNLGEDAMLLPFKNEPVEGEWTLRVHDLAPNDNGRLKFWSLDMQGARITESSGEDRVGQIIPDGDPGGMTRSISLTRAGTIRDMDVSIDITHSNIGDMEITLISPTGKTAILYSHSGGNAENLIRTYSRVNTPALNAFIGDQAAGDWTLKIKDIFSQDQGKLNSWGIRLGI